MSGCTLPLAQKSSEVRATIWRRRSQLSHQIILNESAPLGYRDAKRSSRAAGRPNQRVPVMLVARRAANLSSATLLGLPPPRLGLNRCLLLLPLGHSRYVDDCDSRLRRRRQATRHSLSNPLEMGYHFRKGQSVSASIEPSNRSKLLVNQEKNAMFAILISKISPR